MQLKQFRIGKIVSIFATGLMLPFILGASGCPNLFTSLANTTSDDALLEQAQIYANAKQWTSAIKTVQLMTATGLAATETKVFLASLYAGRCGLDVVLMSNSLTSNLGSGKALWPTLKIAMSGATASSVTDCETAESTILGSLTFADLSADDNVFLAFLEFAKMGAILAADGVDPTNGGTIVSGACAAPPAPGLIPDADVEQLAAGLMVAVGALSASGSTIAGTASTAVTAACAYMNAHGGSNTCSDYTAASWAAQGPVVIQLLHILVNASDVGYNFGSCGSITAGSCSCP